MRSALLLFLLVSRPARCAYFGARLEKYVRGLTGPFYTNPALTGDATPNSLNFGDFQVFNANGENMALNGSCSQGSTGWSSPCSSGVDGNPITWAATGDNLNTDWWFDVALNGTDPPVSIRLFTRVSQVGRASNVTVIIYNLMSPVRAPLWVGRTGLVLTGTSVLSWALSECDADTHADVERQQRCVCIRVANVHAVAARHSKSLGYRHTDTNAHVYADTDSLPTRPLLNSLVETNRTRSLFQPPGSRLDSLQGRPHGNRGVCHAPGCCIRACNQCDAIPKLCSLEHGVRVCFRSRRWRCECFLDS